MDLSLTDRALLYCLQAVPGGPGEFPSAALTKSDWELFLRQADRHGIAPLLYYRLKTSPSGLPVPAEVMGKLQQAYLENAATSAGLYHALGEVLRVLGREALPVIVLKGAHLGAIVYGNSTLRSMCDVDILVRERDLTRVDAALLGMGCIPKEDERTVWGNEKDFVYLMPKWNSFLEVHWNIQRPMCPFKIDHEGLWERAHPAVIAGCETAVLCPEDLLLHLCLHTAYQHGFAPGIRALYDILAVLQHHSEDFDWETVLTRTRAWRADKSVYLTCMLAQELLGAPVPGGLLMSIKPKDYEHFVTLALEQIFVTEAPDHQYFLQHPVLTRFWGSKRIRDKASLFLASVFPSREIIARTYQVPAHSLRVYLYYLIRLKDILQRHHRDVWSRLRGDKRMQGLAQQGRSFTSLKDWLRT